MSYWQKELRVFLICVFCLFAVRLLTSCSKSTQNLPVSAYIDLGNEKIELEVPRTPEQQNIGLMNRTDLELNRGMLFTFNPPQNATFWMKDTKIPLDIIFMRNGQIQKIITVQPCLVDPCAKYSAGEVVDQAIEINAGRASQLGLRTGQFLKLESK